MKDRQIEYIVGEIAAVGAAIDEKKAGQLLSYYEMLIEKNRVMNLTRITDFEEAVQKHFADSLAIVKIVDLNKAQKLMDIGTGGGFPGIPLKICYPHLEVTLLDSVRKKIEFVNDVIRELGLSRSAAVHARAEELARDNHYREQFDICASRAVANLSTLSEYCLPFVRKEGYFAAYKSGESGKEIEDAKRAIQILGGTETEIYNYELYGMGRALVKVHKGRKTPSLYPRKAGIPGKTPL